MIRGTGWLAQLSLHYTHDRHEGPLRVLQRLYPKARESATTCW